MSFLPQRFLACIGLSLTLASPAAAKVALWRIDDGDTKVWLLGTIHALPATVQWHTPAIDQAIASAHELVLETVVDQDPVKTAQIIQSLGTAPGLPPLAERIDPKKRAQLAAMIAKTGVPPAVFDRLKTWAAAVYLFGISVYQVGADGEHGVEPELNQRFAATHRPITGLETPTQQFSFFDALPESEQRRFLEETLDPAKKSKADYDAMLRSWLKGDNKAIAKSFAKEEAASPVLRDVLVRRRNAAWADWLAKRLQKPGSLLVAVGAGHLAGPDSLQNQLAARGIKVDRIE